jgi:lipoate-protein ligase A
VDHSRQEVVEKMIEKFVGDKDYEEGSLTDEEVERARELAEEKFSSEEWNRKL